MVFPYLVAMLLLKIFQPGAPAEWVPQVQFRLLFALGALPAHLGSEDESLTAFFGGGRGDL